MLNIRRTLDDQTPIAMQPILSAFIDDGHFAAHIRRMRLLYAERQHILLQELDSHLGDLVDAKDDEAGMHLIARLSDRVTLTDAEIGKRCAAQGITVQPLSRYYQNAKPPRALVLGYAGLEERDIRSGVKKLARALT